MINFKETLNMPKTDFEMKANLSSKEPIIQKQWFDLDIYHELLNKNSKNEQWVLHDGPPYANGDIHVGHALNKILKDIIVRYKNHFGYYSPYIMGWDTHGLPIEQALIKKLGPKYNELSINEKRLMCSDFADTNIKNQKEQFKKLGIFTDYNKYYATNTKDYEARQLNLFAKMIEDKLIYQALKPVYWSWSSQTALADAEIEYQDLESDSIYVTFKIVSGNKFVLKNDIIIIWTTTPWTIPSNLAIAVNPNFEYLRISVNNHIYIVAKKLLEELKSTFNWSDVKIISEFIGKDLENVTYAHPMFEQISPIILAEYVSSENGTGLVHNAPGFGDDDYLACKKYNIQPYCPVDKFAKFTTDVKDKDLIGIFYQNANEIIINKLKNNDALLFSKKIVHSAACDWRTKKPVIYRATKQWFVDIGNIKGAIIKNLQPVIFTTASNKNHMIDMIGNRNEWCISRQRVWGVPIIIIYENGQPLFDCELVKNITNILQKEGCNTWFDKPVEYFLTSKYLSNKNNVYEKEKDIMDVWFDSGSSHLLLQANKLKSPCDLYFEGNDQYRGWFNSSLITSSIYNGFCPYKQLISHGFIIDEKGQKMSKSSGNGIDPLKVIQQYGADILRMWIANADYTNDVSISDNILKQVAEIYRRIRNSLFKFCLSNIFDYVPNNNDEFSEADLFVLNQLQDNIKTINDAYKSFSFNVIIKTINNHIIELSSWYFDLIKDSLYCDQLNSKKRHAIQTVLYNLLYCYTILLQPIIPHTTEEVYAHFAKENKCKSIILEKWIVKLPLEIKLIDKTKWEQIFKIKQLTNVMLEKLRNDKVINKNNEACVEIKFNNSYKINESLLKEILNVAEVTIIDTKAQEIDIKVSKSNFAKCERCWNYFDHSLINENICPRCLKIINALKKE